MERQGLIKKAGYKYNSAGDPAQRYELTEEGDEKCWAYETEHLSDTDRATLGRCGYDATSEGTRGYIDETQP